MYFCYSVLFGTCCDVPQNNDVMAVLRNSGVCSSERHVGAVFGFIQNKKKREKAQVFRSFGSFCFGPKLGT
jgi:hypothetical protein